MKFCNTGRQTLESSNCRADTNSSDINSDRVPRENRSSMAPFPSIALRDARIFKPRCAEMEITAGLRAAVIEQLLRQLLGKACHLS